MNATVLYLLKTLFSGNTKWEHCTENHIFLFRMSWKDGFSKKNCAGIWSFLYYWERWYFFFPKIWSYTLDGKWKMIFLKEYTEIWYFLQAFWKYGLSKMCRTGAWSFLYYLERLYFFPENMIFFPWAESERLLFSGNTWKHDTSPSEKKTGNRYIGSKFGLSLNLFGWRYSIMNNLQYFVPFSPQELCLGACLSTNKGKHLSIRG